jgi:hypothetical protein
VRTTVSRKALEAIIGRAVLDDEFRLLLFADPNSVLTGYYLTKAELASVKSVDAESLDACAKILRRSAMHIISLESV